MNLEELKQVIKLHDKWIKTRKLEDWSAFNDYTNKLDIDWMERSVSGELFIDVKAVLTLLNKSKAIGGKE